MRLTKEKAIELSIELWEWMAKTGTEYKDQWTGWEKYALTSKNDCFLCEYNDMQGGRSLIDCSYCPYFEKFGRCVDNSIFGKWAYTETKRTRKKYAKLFLEQLKEL